MFFRWAPTCAQNFGSQLDVITRQKLSTVGQITILGLWEFLDI